MIYDDFQKKAIETIDQRRSLIVSAPTGAGKTVIAEYAIEQALAHNEGAIYTAPIKALSNQKYRDFKAKYGDKIGILTGDVSINPDAPILIMTTEIYRNTLFETSLSPTSDRAHGIGEGKVKPDRLQNTKWVIFDEVHYLDDWERGTVWEEAIMFSPPHLELLCLSATVPNIDEITNWIKTVLNRPIEIITETHRPVPLIHLFQCQGQILNNQKKLREQGYMNRDDWSQFGGRHAFRRRQRGHHNRNFNHLRAMPNRIDKLIAHLKAENRLPCIFFAFGRRRTEELAHEVHVDFLNEDERSRATKLYDDLCIKFGIGDEQSAMDMRGLIERGIGFHHAGMLPTLKEVIEQLFTSKLLKMIFTTETFALGINMPARAVVFDELRKFYGTHFANLRTRDFYQMAGRAGRRGMDKEGFVYSRVNPHQVQFQEIVRIINGKPEPINSQFNATYATVLNLYAEHGRELLHIYPKTLHHYQSSKKGRQKASELLERKILLLGEMDYLNEKGLTLKGEFASCLYGYELLLSEMHDQGLLDAQDPAGLAIVLSALVFEPRKNIQLDEMPKKYRNLNHHVESFLRRIHRIEMKHRVMPLTKQPYFHFAPIVEKWIQKESFDDIMRASPLDEGEVIRYFRMVIQLLREVWNAPHASDRLIATAKSAFNLINRDIVDAERQLRL